MPASIRGIDRSKHEIAIIDREGWEGVDIYCSSCGYLATHLFETEEIERVINRHIKMFDVEGYSKAWRK